MEIFAKTNKTEGVAETKPQDKTVSEQGKVVEDRVGIGVKDGAGVKEGVTAGGTQMKTL